MLNEFFGHLKKDDKEVVYGLDEVVKELKNENVRTLLISNDIAEEVLLCSITTREGQQFKEIGGIGAILKKVNHEIK